MLTQTSKRFSFSDLYSMTMFVFRVVIGWHFLYEGVTKLLIPGWSSAAYLMQSRWLFSSFYHWIASEPTLLSIVDFMNIWGLILIGLGLFLGAFTRAAGLSGAFLLLLYYFANPPFIVSDYLIPQEGHYFLINKNIIEVFALIIIAIYPKGNLYGVDRLFGILREKVKSSDKSKAESFEGSAVPEKQAMSFNRREILKNLATVPILGIFAYLVNKKHRWETVHAITGATITLRQSQLKELKGELPKGKLGNLEVSRVILGCNLIGGWAHARDLLYAEQLFKAYNTDKKVFETMEIAEKAGINTIFSVAPQLPLIRKYNDITGGKIQTICQTILEDNFDNIDKAIDVGATSMYVQGAVADKCVFEGNVEFLGKALEHIKSQGYLGGIGGHSIQTIMACEKAGLKPDYYCKTIHHDNYISAHPKEYRKEYEVIIKQLRNEGRNGYYDNMWDLFPEQTIEFMENVKVPWIGFKVLAAGAIHPKDGFRYAFENGADFICVGMFDFQIVEDVNIAIDVLDGCANRRRPIYT